MLSFLRARTPARTVAAHLPAPTYEQGRVIADYTIQSTSSSDDSGHEWLVTHTLPAGECGFFPPLHYHAFQSETFHVASGTARFFCDGAEIVASAGEEVTVPVGAYHRFVNASADAELVLRVRLDVADVEAEEAFFRNFFGYLDDCAKAGTAPSLFQLERFLCLIDCPVAVLPAFFPKWMRAQFDWSFMLLTGKVVGEYLLGYKGSYPEYYNPKGDGKKLN